MLAQSGRPSQPQQGHRAARGCRRRSAWVRRGRKRIFIIKTWCADCARLPTVATASPRALCRTATINRILHRHGLRHAHPPQPPLSLEVCLLLVFVSLLTRRFAVSNPHLVQSRLLLQPNHSARSRCVRRRVSRPHAGRGARGCCSQSHLTQHGHIATLPNRSQNQRVAARLAVHHSNEVACSDLNHGASGL